MTLQALFQLMGNHPLWVLSYFGLVPFMAWIINDLSKGQAHRSPWNYSYATLIYLSTVPGIFSLTFTIWMWLFERRSILEMDVYFQIAPVLSMLLTLYIIKRQVDLDYIPGFDRLSGLITMIAAALVFFWILDKTRIVVFSYMPFGYALLLFAGLLLLMRTGWKRFSGD